MIPFLSFLIVFLYLVFLKLSHFGLLPLGFLLPVTVGVIGASLVIYVRSHHIFPQYTGQQLLFTIFASTLIIVAVAWMVAIQVFSVLDFQTVPDLSIETEDPGYLPDGFLPSWWLALFFGGILLIIAYDVFTLDGNIYEYVNPSSLDNLNKTPILFGLSLGILGIWGLFIITFPLPRVIVVAPVFEELLKFGIALFFGTALFGRSVYARIAIGLLVGVLFGVVEHIITYPHEPDTVYLFRVVFHGLTAGLSIAVYTKFEQYSLYSVTWVAPVLPILFHFMYNSFVVAISLIFYESSLVIPQQLIIGFGSIAILVLSAALLLTLREVGVVLDFHEAIHDFGNL